MILARAPLRLSFFGGGSDIPTHCDLHGGATLSATFDTFVYASVIATPTPHIKVSYSQTEYANAVREVRHTLVREALRYYDITSGIEVASFADIPTVGTGLGASSAFCVALALALARHTQPNRTLSIHERITHATDIELHRAGSPIGYQDHIAAAHGGMIFAEYRRASGGDTPWTLHAMPQWDELFARLLLVKMPARQVSANHILQQGMDPTNVQRLAALAYEGRDCVRRQDLSQFGALLHTAWEEKKASHPAITTPEIDAAYEAARRAGALGGKLLGAGSGGYLLLCAPTERVLRDLHLLFDFTGCATVRPVSTGATIVYDDTYDHHR